MKTTEIKDLLKKDLLIVELPNVETEISIGLHCIGIKPPPIGKDASDTNGYYHIYKEMFHSYTLLGKPDEIREEDVVDLCDRIGINNPLADCDFFADYGNDDRMFETALESFNSAIETVIFWDVNPIDIQGQTFSNEHENRWQQAQEKTFDRNRSIILVKN